MNDVLIIFARYPEVGKCKTRLVDALGAEGATELHSAMTQRTLAWAHQLAMQHQVQIQVRFAGGDSHLMLQRFGDDHEFLPQSDGDLGQRMYDAFLFCQQQLCADRIVVVGTDCPELTVEHVWRAFERLEHHDVCVTPATDGGYVLLGVNLVKACQADSLFSDLFSQKRWGTSSVLRETMLALAAGDRSVCLMPALSDVDLPQDLHVWERAIGAGTNATQRLSVIIPVLGREELLEQVLAVAQSQPEVEVILVAAGDRQHAMQLAASRLVQLIASPVGRATQMNLGAAIANTEILLFLHADTLLPPDFSTLVQNTLEDHACVAGAFRLRIDSTRLGARLVELGVRLRCWLLQLPYGDQAIFLRRSDFVRLGGYNEQPIMEDYDLIRRLQKFGRVKVLDRQVITSARRWVRLGFLKTMLINQMIVLAYKLGVSPQRLADFYRRQRNPGDSQQAPRAERHHTSRHTDQTSD